MALSPGVSVGPYEIVAQIGAGGMGEVYQARDPRLRRDVAIKVLPDSVAGARARLDRFEREARAVATLSHPNILAVFDVGTGPPPFLVTELLEGETLRSLVAHGPVPLKTATDIALQLVSGLTAAHARGLVHRDLKPENVFLTRDGVVKILDFGLAKDTTAVQESSDADLTREGATLAGTVLGTAGYMAPEQVRGETIDVRSDIFAVGAILYELASGQRAFAGPSVADTVSAVLREHPRDLEGRSGTPPAFARIVRRCLEKDAARRFQSASDLRFAIDGVAAAPGAELAGKTDDKSIAVLPFTNMSADADNQYFSDGLAEELINALTRLPGLRVAARTSAFRFRGSEVDIRQVGRDLQVSTVVEGSVRRAGNRLRVTAQLINVADGYHLWSERYDREMADVFDIQDDIVESIVKAVAPTLVGDARTAVRRPTENLEAYELYLRGRHHAHLRTPNAMQVAQQIFEQVIALDPDYALAWAGLADCLSVRRLYGWVSFAQSRDRAREAALRAMSLDPSLADVNLAQAMFIFYFEREWRRAEPFIRRAVALNPRFVNALGYLGVLLVQDDRVAEVPDLIARIREVDPLSPYAHYLVASICALSGRWESCEVAARRVLELQPDALAGLWILGIALSGLERHEAAVGVMERVLIQSRAPVYLCMSGLVLARAGRTDDARRLLGGLDDRGQRGEYVAPHTLFWTYFGLGDVDGMTRALHACVAEAAPFMGVRTVGAFIDRARIDPEVARLYDMLSDGSSAPPPDDG